MGFFDSLGKGWSFIKAAFAMAGQNKKLLLPSLYQVITWALRLGLKYKARSDVYTLATHVSGQ